MEEYIILIIWGLTASGESICSIFRLSCDINPFNSQNYSCLWIALVICALSKFVIMKHE